MSYTPTNWKRGDVITAEKLNNMESGIAAAGIFEIIQTAETPSIEINKTVNEIVEAIEAGMSLFYVLSPTGGPTDGIVVRLPLISFKRDRVGAELTPTGNVSDQNTFSFGGFYRSGNSIYQCYFATIIVDEGTVSVTTENRTISLSN